MFGLFVGLWVGDGHGQGITGGERRREGRGEGGGTDIVFPGGCESNESVDRHLREKENDGAEELMILMVYPRSDVGVSTFWSSRYRNMQSWLGILTP